ncbi:RagB/SusD family nutrient uptake outer membrane protein [Bacteroidota bacterium]
MKKILFISIILLAVLMSCTDLDVEVYHDIVSENFFKTELQVLTAAGPAYTNLKGYVKPEGVYGLNELTTDELLIPTRGSHWDNAGIYRRFHKHEWTIEEGDINAAWSYVYTGVSSCNRIIYIYEQVEEKTEALLSVSNELKTVRAFYLYVGLDLFGNIPIVYSYDVPEEYAPANNTSIEVFDFIESEITEGITLLNNANDISTYGRINRYGAYTLLAKLYLNAEVFTGESMWDETIEACDSVIESGRYSLNEDYYANFSFDNETQTVENIFVIPFDDIEAPDWGGPGMFQLNLWTMHFSSAPTYNMSSGGWNGMCAVPSFYRSYDENDIRRAQWLVGVQYGASGEVLYCTQERNGDTLNFTVDLTSLEVSYENEGARWAKYDYTDATNSQLRNDFVVFRYTDVLLMKAEALMRKNGGAATAEAVDLVNQIRARAFPDDASKLYTTSTLTLDELLAERGREFAGENLRRNDLIRFGKYNDPTDFRPVAAADHYNLFPIPSDQISTNPNLTQNPGY